MLLENLHDIFASHSDVCRRVIWWMGTDVSEKLSACVQGKLKMEISRFIRNVAVVSVTIYGVISLKSIILIIEIRPLTQFVNHY